jgi:aryl-alcohol dehydrogenase-like predicted oxidoreductase
MAEWAGSDDVVSLATFDEALHNGINFIDTALSYGSGKSERLIGSLGHDWLASSIRVATKVPPLGGMRMATPADDIADFFPPSHIKRCVDASLANLNGRRIHLLQFHTWTDTWAHDRSWREVVTDLKQDGLIGGIGISANRWRHNDCLQTLQTGEIDAIQVIYNIFDQDPRRELFPLCHDLDVAVIVRVPFDEGSLTGALYPGIVWPEDDWRNAYFTSERLGETLDRVQKVRTILEPGQSLSDLALRFVLSESDVSCVITGMRRPQHVSSNVRASHRGGLDPVLLDEMRSHAWRRDSGELDA